MPRLVEYSLPTPEEVETFPTSRLIRVIGSIMAHPQDAGMETRGYRLRILRLCSDEIDARIPRRRQWHMENHPMDPRREGYLSAIEQVKKALCVERLLDPKFVGSHDGRRILEAIAALPDDAKFRGLPDAIRELLHKLIVGFEIKHHADAVCQTIQGHWPEVAEATRSAVDQSGITATFSHPVKK